MAFHWIRRAVRRIKIIYHWLPIIWNDYDWDDCFILEALRHKIERTRIEIARNERHTTCKKDVKDMRIAELLIKRIQDNDYYEHYKNELCTCTDPLPDCFGEPNERGSVPWICPFCEWCQLKTTVLRSRYREKYDWEYLFKHLSKHMRKWWD